MNLFSGRLVLCCHSGLDPWFDRPFDRLMVLSDVDGLTTLSGVEGESRLFPYVRLTWIPGQARNDEL